MNEADMAKAIEELDAEVAVLRAFVLSAVAVLSEGNPQVLERLSGMVSHAMNRFSAPSQLEQLKKEIRTILDYRDV